MKRICLFVCLIAIIAINIINPGFAYGSGKAQTKISKIKIKSASKKVVQPKSIKVKPVIKTSKGNTTTSAVATSGVSKNSTFNLHAFYSGKTKFDSGIENELKGLNTVSFAWLNLKNNNGEVVVDNKDNKTDFHMPDDYYKPIQACVQNKIPAQIAVFSDGNTAKAIMADSTLKDQLINKLLDSLTLKLPDNSIFNFNGIVIDFEGFRNNDTSQYFNSFLKDLKAKLMPLNKKLFVVVNVRSYWPGYDYKEIFKYADKVILMAHDYQPSGNLTKQEVQRYINYSGLDPILTLAPINSVQAALEDLISCVNSEEDMSKIWLQINLGISQWQFKTNSEDGFNQIAGNVAGTRVNPTYDMLISRVLNKDKLATGIKFSYINELESPLLTYFNTKTKTFNFILYEDNRSVKAKIDMAKLKKIDGISLWRLGNIPDSNETVVKSDNLNVWSAILNAMKK